MFSLALENDKLDTIWEEVRMTRQILLENPTFVKTICHPEITSRAENFVASEIRAWVPTAT